MTFFFSKVKSYLTDGGEGGWGGGGRGENGGRGDTLHQFLVQLRFWKILISSHVCLSVITQYLILMICQAESHGFLKSQTPTRTKVSSWWSFCNFVMCQNMWLLDHQLQFAGKKILCNLIQIPLITKNIIKPIKVGCTTYMPMMGFAVANIASSGLHLCAFSHGSKMLLWQLQQYNTKKWMKILGPLANGHIVQTDPMVNIHVKSLNCWLVE